MKLIDNWRGALKHYSTLALSGITGLGGTWAGLPDEVKSGLPGWAHKAILWAIFAVAVFGLGGKFVDQSPKDPQ